MSFLARELSEYLMVVFPRHAPEIQRGIGLLLVSCVGVFCLRPIFLCYSDRGGENKGADTTRDGTGPGDGDSH